MVTRHGSACRCDCCAHVAVLLAFAKADEALHAAYADGLVRDLDIELAFATGRDPLELVGFDTRPLVTS